MFPASHAGESIAYSTKQKATGEMDAPIEKNEVITVFITPYKYQLQVDQLY